jgi:hypothetical protein
LPSRSTSWRPTSTIRPGNFRRPGRTELGIDPRGKLPDLEGLDDVVVGADLQPDHDVHRVGAGGDHHDRDLDTGGAEAPADVETGEAREGQVEDDQVDVAGLGEANAVQAILRELDAEAVLLPEDGEDVVHRGVVVNDEHGRLGDPGAAAQRGCRVENAVVREGAHPVVPLEWPPR